MPNTKRSYKEPDRSPLQLRASSLLSNTFPAASGGRNRPCTIRNRNSVTKLAAAAGVDQQQQPSILQPSVSTSCPSPTLEQNTAHILAPSSDQLLLPTNLLHLDSLDDAEFDLQDLILDEGDDVLTVLPPGPPGHKSTRPTEAALAVTAAAGEPDQHSSLPTGALLCQQLSQQLSGQHASSPTHQLPVSNAPVQQQQQQQQQQQDPGKQEGKPIGSTVAAADVTLSSGFVSPVVDGTAYIMEASMQVGHLQTETSAASDAGAAATTDESDRFTAIDTMLEQLSVDAMLHQQFSQYQQQQQYAGQLAANPGNAVMDGAMPQRSSNPPNVVQQQQYNQWYENVPAATSGGDDMQAQGVSAAATAAAGVDNHCLPPVPQAWQQIESSAYNTPQLRASAADPVSTQQHHQAQQFIDASSSLQPFSFQALLLDEDTSASHQHTQQQQQQQQLMMMPQPGLHEAAAEAVQPEQLAGTPASNYLLLQQQQQQRRLLLQQQQQHAQVQPFPSTSFSGSGPPSAAAARSLPAAYTSRSPLPSGAQMAQQQDIQGQATFPSFNQQQASYSHSFNSGGNIPTAPFPAPKPIITTGATGMQYRNATADQSHVNAAMQQAYPLQAPPQQQMSASQQELQALKQQLAEEKRRRKEKKKLKKMHKLLEQQQQQQQYGDLHRQQSGLSQQVLSAACHQHQVSPGKHPTAAAAAEQLSGSQAARQLPYQGASSLMAQPPSHQPNLMQGWLTPEQQPPSLSQQHSWPQPISNARAVHNNAGPTYRRSSSHTEYAGRSAVNHAWQHRGGGNNSSPHAVAAGYPIDCASASCQQAVAESLRQLAKKPERQQQQSRASDGQHGLAAAAAGVAQANVTTQGRSHTQNQVFGSGSSKYSPFSGYAGQNISFPNSEPLQHGQMGGTSGDQQYQLPLDGTSGDQLHQSPLDGTSGYLPARSGLFESRSADLSVQHSRLPSAASAVPTPIGLESPNQLSSSAGGTAVERAAGQPVSSNAGFDHNKVLPGVPVVLDLGDKEPDSQPKLAGAALMAPGLKVENLNVDGTQLQQDQLQYATDSQNCMILQAAAAAGGMQTGEQPNLSDFEAMQAPVLTGSTEPVTYRGQVAMHPKGDGMGHAEGLAGYDQSGMIAVQQQQQQQTASGGAASPASTSSSGRKRTYEQTSGLMQDVKADSSSHLEPSISASPTEQVHMGQSPPNTAAGVAGGSANIVQVQQAGGSSQRKARLLQLPFNGLDLAEKRDRQRDTVPATLQQTAAAAAAQVSSRNVSSATPGARLLSAGQLISQQLQQQQAAQLQPGNSHTVVCNQPPAAMPGTMPPQMLANQLQGQAVTGHHSKTHSGSEYGASWWPVEDAELMDARAGSQTGSRKSSFSMGGYRPVGSTAAATGSRSLLSPRDTSMSMDQSMDQNGFSTPHTAMSMPPPPPQAVAGVSSAAAAAAAGSGSGSPADNGLAGSAGGGGGNGAGGFNPVLGAGNIYRTSSGKVLRMLTHPVTGKPLLLGPAVDAKSSRLGNTSLGAPAPQLFGCELQTNSNSGGTSLGASAGSAVAGTTSIMSGGSSLGSPGHSSSNSFRGECSGNSRIRRQGTLRARRRSNSGRAPSDMDVQYCTEPSMPAAANHPAQPLISNPGGINAAGLTCYPSSLSISQNGEAIYDQFAANAAQGMNSARSFAGGNIHQEVPRGELERAYGIGAPASEVNESWGAALAGSNYQQAPAFGDEELLIGQAIPNQRIAAGQPYNASAATPGMFDLMLDGDVPPHLA